MVLDLRRVLKSLSMTQKLYLYVLFFKKLPESSIFLIEAHSFTEFSLF